MRVKCVLSSAATQRAVRPRHAIGVVPFPRATPMSNHEGAASTNGNGNGLRVLGAHAHAHAHARLAEAPAIAHAPTSIPRATRTPTPAPDSPVAGGRSVRCLGPVPDLEHHLPPDWWRTLFNAVYLKTDGDFVENAELTRGEVDRILQASGLGKDDRVLDLCCGQGRHALEIARRGFAHVTGVDRSRYLVRLARRRAQTEKSPTVFREGDARTARLKENSFDAVLILGNSFGYFDSPDDDRRVLASVARWLRPGGTLVLDLADGDYLRTHYEPRSWEWIDQHQLVCRERSLSADGSRLVCREVVVDAETGVIADQFYAERLYSFEQLRQLLEAEGFQGVRLHGNQESHHDARDPGMLARRFLVTTMVAKRPNGHTTGAVAFPDVTVLMGDPRLPDSVKLGGRFNAEDMDTINRLQEALTRLPDYKFTYIDNHATLLSTLQRERPSFVFNLCDEGFDNDALKELHVPSVLEMLGIPYSGSGPTCLGLCYDKGLVGAIAQSLDVPVPRETFVAASDMGGTIPAVFPALIKPALGDSSLGITEASVVNSPEEAVRQLKALRASLPGRDVLVQEYLTGTEYTVAIVGNIGLGHTVLPILEVDYSGLPKGLPPILSYASKWDPDSPYWTQIKYQETTASEEVQRALIDGSVRLFERLGCRDYARFDFRADAQGVPKLLEVNPNPGWCWDGKLNLMAEFAGFAYRDLLRMILEAAQQRYIAGKQQL